jgi:ATP-dependent Clp protease ATP-binding subunit ClpA
MELALREALQLGHRYIGTEHILLGLIREGDGVAARVLVELGADLNRVRQQVIQLLRVKEPEPSAPVPRKRTLLSRVEVRRNWPEPVSPRLQDPPPIGRDSA